MVEASEPGKKRSVDSATLFVVAFGLNVVWEFAHSWLYTTCRAMSFFALTKLLVWQAFKDALWISGIYYISPNLFVFVAVLLLFAYIVEWHALKTKRWEYAPEMPRIFGVGLTPLLELSVTGLLAVFLVSL